MRFFAQGVLAIALLFCHAASAITNIESIRHSGKAEGIEVAIDLAMRFQRGNTDHSQYAASLKLMDFTDRRQRIVVLDHDYARDGDRKTTDRSFAHLRHVWLRDGPLDYELFVQFQSNEFTFLQQRSLAGAGIRRQLLDSTLHSLHMGLGGYYTRERYRSALASEENHDWRGNLYLSYRLQWLENLGWVNTVYVQPKFGHAADVYALNDSRLESFINHHLSLFVSVVHMFDNRPFADNKRLDSERRAGLMLRF
ncbi:MAG TPA: DUF481 domain-containing protein [Pseudomonadales bacterium]